MVKEFVEMAKAYLTNRKVAYHQVFSSENLFSEVVLKDLAKFCRAHEPTFHTDPRIHAALEGRREVWLRIQQHLNLTPDQLWKLYGRKDLE